MANACRIEFDNSDNGSFRLTCNRESDIKWIDVLKSNGKSAHIYPGNAYSVSDMYYDWFIIAEALTGEDANNEYKIIGVFTKNSDYIVGIYLTANGYNKIEINNAEIKTVRISDIENVKINSNYNCIFNTDNEVNVLDSEDTYINIIGKVLNSRLTGSADIINGESGRIKLAEGIIKYVYNLTTDIITDSNQSVEDAYTVSFGNMYIIFNSVTNEICAIIVYDNRQKTMFTYEIYNHNIQRFSLADVNTSYGLQVSRLDILGYHTVYVNYPDGANINVSNTEA